MGVIAKYKFNNTQVDVLPEFNSGYTRDMYTVTDVVDGEVTTRTIESDVLPTKLAFSTYGNYRPDAAAALLEVLELDTSAVTTMDSMFSRCTNLTSVCAMDTSQVTNMRYMFYICSNLTSVEGMSQWDTSKVTDMNFMFYNCRTFDNFDISNFDTTNVGSMYGMFRGLDYEEFDVSHFNTSNVTSMAYTFEYCECSRIIGLEFWDTSKVTTMTGMFSMCTNLESLDGISGWDIGQVSTIDGIFRSCTSLSSLDLSSWDTSSITNMSNMFINCNQVTTLGDLSGWDTSKVQSMISVFHDCKKLKSVDVSSWDTRNVTSIKQMFWSCTALESLDLRNWNTSKVTSMHGTFSNCTTLESLDLSGLDTRKVTNMNGLFQQSRNLQSIKLGDNWSTSLVTTMESMFAYCISLKSLDFSDWDTSNTTNMRRIFNNCHKLESLNISGWDTSKVTELDDAFSGTALESLDLSGWSTPNLINSSRMFFNCTKLRTLDISNFKLHDTTPHYIFDGCTNLSDIGMIYCDYITINKLVSVMNMTVPRTIWVGTEDTYHYTNMDNLTYRTQRSNEVNTVSLQLTYPLYEGDRIDIVDGEIYHYHRMTSTVLDGSENWLLGRTGTSTLQFLFEIPEACNAGVCFSDRFVYQDPSLYESDIEMIHVNQRPAIVIGINKSKLTEPTVDAFKSWLSSNPVTVVYELEDPYYELLNIEYDEIVLESFKDCYLIYNTSVGPTTTLRYSTAVTSTYKLQGDLDQVNEIASQQDEALLEMAVQMSLRNLTSSEEI